MMLERLSAEPLKKKLQEAIDANRELLTTALLPSVAKNPQLDGNGFLGNTRAIKRSNTCSEVN
jgi:hypothetical protein